MPIPGYDAPAHAVALSDVKAYLGVSSSTHDSELTSMRDAAEEWVTAYRNGHMAYQAEIVDTLSGDGTPTLLLSRSPVDSVTSVVENGTTLAATAYAAGDDGTITRLVGTYTPGEWPAGHANVVVTYVAGDAAQPARVQTAVLEVVRHFWETQRGGVQPGGSTGDEWASSPDDSIRQRIRMILGNQPSLA